MKGHVPMQARHGGVGVAAEALLDTSASLVDDVEAGSQPADRHNSNQQAEARQTATPSAASCAATAGTAAAARASAENAGDFPAEFPQQLV
jgi:hypothetical protein